MRPAFIPPTWVKVVLAHALALAVGGAAALFLPPAPASTALGRVGRALGGQERATAEDVATAREALRGTTRDVFDLAIALRGLGSGSAPDWARAQAVCEKLKWARCERGTLEDMARQVKQ
jgi:hypothetical protein